MTNKGKSPHDFRISGKKTAVLAPGKAATLKVALRAGKAAYLANCAACHQPDGKGLAGAFPPLADSDYIRNVPKDRLVDVVLKGLSGKVKVNGVDYDGVMPALNHLSDTDIANVLSYVANSWGNAGANVAAADVAPRRGTIDPCGRSGALENRC